MYKRQVHHHGRAIDANNALDGEGPFSPERAGTLPAGQLIDLCFSGQLTKDELKKRISGRAGLTAHLGTTDVPAIIQSIEEGDKKAELIPVSYTHLYDPSTTSRSDYDGYLSMESRLYQRCV